MAKYLDLALRVLNDAQQTAAAREVARQILENAGFTKDEIKRCEKLSKAAANNLDLPFFFLA
ncbi:hypothetical protein [Alteromonas flava]|uniref:hypothetical protein n=1 Tax=Alteromonas flava TaxID=2048003 RepID=UPI000C291F57|nr:hypothetical protein [Alteromonas flava]